MARTFKLTKSGTYYYRRRTLSTVEVVEDGSQIVGSEVECLKTRWGFQRSKYRRATDAYYHQQTGTWCRINSRVATAWDENGNPTEWLHCFEPIESATLIDRYPDSPSADGLPECVIKVEQGKAVKVESAGVSYYDQSLPVEYLAELLGLDRKKRKSPKKAA